MDRQRRKAMSQPNGLNHEHDSTPDPILLTLFANRFMSVAEAMGRSLQQTSISTNIKERLDFSCALFSPDGDLVANAPYIPIHLGSMSL
jgi:5-oxoprolinase (ATP-hydrolysing)